VVLGQPLPSAEPKVAPVPSFDPFALARRQNANSPYQPAAR
jgi:hypothetical protein